MMRGLCALPRLISAELSEVVANGVTDALRTGARTALTGREGQLSSERDSEAASLATRRCYMRLNRAAGWVGGLGGRRRGPSTGGPAERVPVLGRL